MSEQSPTQKRRVPPVVIVGIILAALCGIAMYIRIHLPYDHIFVNDWVWFRETDAYYYMRHIENMIHNFPHFNTFDPYMIFPGGGGGIIRPFFAWLVAGITLLISGGEPARHTMETVGVYMPTILGALTVIPVYFIGKELFNRWVGVISAALVAILPGEFLHRSLLGFTDHHVAETLFSAVSILFLIMAIKRSRERDLSFSHFLNKDRSTITRPLVYALLAGFFLGLYLLSWQGGLLFIFVILAYLLIQFIVDHLRRKSTDYLCIVGTPLFLVAFLMLLPVLGAHPLDDVYRVAMPVAILLPVALSAISRLMAGRAWKPFIYPLALVGLAGIGVAVLRAINPSLFEYMLRQFTVFAPTAAMRTVIEVQALTPRLAWGNFTTSFFISFVSFAMLIYVVIKEKGADKILFLVWSIIMLIAVLSQRRFGYYYAVNAALLTGYFSWKMLDLAGLRKILARPAQVVGTIKKFKRKEKKTREKSKPKTFMQPRGAWIGVILVGIIIFFAVFLPNIPALRVITGTPPVVYGHMSDGWYESLLWLKDNTPDPFDDPDFYYELYPPRGEFEYPDTAYGVMSWWDYGYYIMQVSRRIPNSNPGQVGAVQAGRFFTTRNITSASEIADDRGTKYVMIGYSMLTWPSRTAAGELVAITGKFYAMAEWAGVSVDEFYGIYFQETGDGRLRPEIYYYPSYYNSTVVRLYIFDGEAVVPRESKVISYEEREIEGFKYNRITDTRVFPTYEEAEAYVAAREVGNYRIVSSDPFSSPVPLEKMEQYERVHQSEAITVERYTLPGVKTFEYLGFGES